MRLKAFVFCIALLSLYVAFSNITSSSDFIGQATRSENVIDGFIDQAARRSDFPQLGPDISPLNLSVPALTPLRQIDREKYTIRINTWRRPELLLQNVAYLSACEGVAEIQVVWCDVKNDPPADLTTNFTNVKVDRRAVNSLNERFNLSGIGSPTLGIIHIDDDDLFSCIALDNIFFRWTYNTERLVGLYPRHHNEESHKYYGWSRSSRENIKSVPKGRYTMALPTIGGVVHRDYLDWYTKYFPRPFYIDIAKDFNCEDIALNFFISALTRGKPPLLGDFWAQRATVHNSDYQTYSSISAENKHWSKRSNCTDRALRVLGLTLVPYGVFWTSMVPKDKQGKFKNRGDLSEEDLFPLNFEVGATGNVPTNNTMMVPRHSRMMKVLDEWKASPSLLKSDCARRVKRSRRPAVFQKVY